METAEPNLELIIQFVSQKPDGATLPEIIEYANGKDRTVQRWVADLVDSHRLKSKGKGRATRYLAPKPRITSNVVTATDSPTAEGRQTSTGSVPPSAPNIRQSAATGPVAPTETYRQPAAVAPTTSAAMLGQAAPAGPVALPANNRKITAAPHSAARGSGDASSGWQQPPADAPFARYPDFEELYYHIFPRIVRTCMNRTNAESVVREQADFDYRTDPKRKQAFIAAAMAKLDSLTLADVHPYGVGPTTYGDWRRGWNEPPGTRHW